MDPDELAFLAEIREEFSTSLEEELDYVEKHLLQFESSGDASEVDEVKRRLHSIKGSAYSAELPEVGDFIHEVEDKLLADKESIETSLKGIDKLRKWLEVFKESGESTFEAA